ncbi:PIF1-like helicase [Hirsutella rhossiliensis]|uniref:ATP-dependent DNA helicase PIF1 n=1 Tax=Hirsutella rhossiliensis TaxID=111463 RepID=A0A9P8SF62_9HYPO|nr:PIF1-like helicase domain-containing protein [Hirsutella rhossiliensis]KAH0959105.1 PIF1-like helicase domain-containing protein [Hirsutella rhossiliensis]
MLSRGRDQGTSGGKAPASRSGLAQQPFPPSSPGAPNGNIRDQFKKLGHTGSGAGPALARVAQPPSKPIHRRPVNMMPASRAGYGGQLQSLCGNSDSFKQNTSSLIDLTAPDAEAKAAVPVWFAEDDFSDDENLDLDYEAPTALPVLPPSKPLTQESMPPPPPPSHSEAPIPWSSSPASHLLPPKSQRPLSDGASLANPSFLKRESSGENEVFEIPAPKKAKNLWDTSASAIKEQKKQLKSQRNQRLPGGDTSTDDAREAEAALAAKPVAISLSSEQRQVLDLVVNKKASVFFTGPAGAGKSVLMRAIISELKQKYARDPERVAVTASTGLAACNIGGITLHSFSGIGLGKEEAPVLVKKVRRNPKAKNRWLKTKYLIIDEISMVDGELFDKLSHVGRVIRNNGRPWGGIQLIITGDFFQLPPVPDHDRKSEGIKFAFDAATWSTSIDHTIGLTQIFRQRDPEFAAMLNEMRLGRISHSTVEAFKALSRPLKFDDGVDSAELYPTRAQVDGSNERRLRELPGQVHRYEAMDVGDPAIRDKLLGNMMSPKSLDLKVNAQVMLIKNLDDTLVNGSLGKVIAFSDEKTFEMTSVNSYDSDMDDNMARAKRKLKGFSRDADVSSSNGRKFPVVQFVSTGGVPRVILCQPEEWKVELPNGEVQAKRTQLPLILAWALSIHKAQGQTLERVTVNLGRVFEKGQAYVALSRATCQQGLRVLGFDKSKVMAHARVVDFYDKLYSVEQLSARPGNISDFIANRNGTRPEALARPGKGAAKIIDLDDDEDAMASCGY